MKTCRCSCRRKGVVLLVVLGLLMVMALAALTFTTFARMEEQAARNFRQVVQGQTRYASLPPDPLFQYALSFLMYDSDDPNPAAGLPAAGARPCWKGESLLADMFGNDHIAFNGDPTQDGSANLHRDEDYDFPDTRADVATGARNANRYLCGWNLESDGRVNVQVASFEDMDAFGDIEKSFPDRVSSRHAAGQSFRIVDNDGDGQKDGVWVDLGYPAVTVDLGYPAVTSPSGYTFKPLFSFMIFDLNGRVDLNAAGNLVRQAGSNRTTASNEGATPTEINLHRIFLNAAGTGPDLDGSGRTKYLSTGLKVLITHEGNDLVVHGKYSNRQTDPAVAEPPPESYDWYHKGALPAPDWARYQPGNKNDNDAPANTQDPQVDENGNAGYLNTYWPAAAPDGLDTSATDSSLLGAYVFKTALMNEGTAEQTNDPAEFNLYDPSVYDTPFTFVDLDPLLERTPEEIEATLEHLRYRPALDSRLWWLLGNQLVFRYGATGDQKRQTLLRRQAVAMNLFSPNTYPIPTDSGASDNLKRASGSVDPHTDAVYYRKADGTSPLKTFQDLNDIVQNNRWAYLWQMLLDVIPGSAGWSGDNRYRGLAQLWCNIRDLIDEDYNCTSAYEELPEPAKSAVNGQGIYGFETPTLVLNEVLAFNNGTKQYVFVEIHNPTPVDIDLAGWQLVIDKTADENYNATAADQVSVIASGTNYLIKAAGDANGRDYLLVTNATAAEVAALKTAGLPLPSDWADRTVTADAGGSWHDNPDLAAKLIWPGAAAVQFWLRRPPQIESPTTDPWTELSNDNLVIADGFREATTITSPNAADWLSYERTNRLYYDAVSQWPAGGTTSTLLEANEHPDLEEPPGPFYHNQTRTRMVFTNVGQLMSYVSRLSYTPTAHPEWLGLNKRWWVAIKDPNDYLVDWRDLAWMNGGKLTTGSDDTRAKLWRLFGLLGVNSRMAGYDPAATDGHERVVGRVNVNTANLLVLRALLDDGDPTAAFDAANPTGHWIAEALIRSRADGRKSGGKNAFDGSDVFAADHFNGDECPFRSFLVDDLDDTLLRDAHMGTDSSYDDNKSLFDQPPASGQTGHEPYYRWRLWRKISNNVTTVSHQFACWITVGFFYWDTATHQPKQVGPDWEIGGRSRNLRYRGLFILDRSRAAIAPNKTLWDDDGVVVPISVVYRRIVEARRGGWD